MKHYILTASALLIALLSFGQNSFLRIYKSDQDNITYSIIQNSNNDYLLAGRIQIENGIYYPYLLKISDSGSIIVEKTDTLLVDGSYTRILNKHFDPYHHWLFCNSQSEFSSKLDIYSIDDQLIKSNPSTFVFTDNLATSVQDAINVSDSILFCLLIRQTNEFPDFALLKYKLNDSSFQFYQPTNPGMRIPSNLFLDTSDNLKISYWGQSLRLEGANKILTFDFDLNQQSIFAFSTDIVGDLRISGLNDTSFLATGSSYSYNDTQRVRTYKVNYSDAIVDSIELNYGYDTISYPGAGRCMLVTDSNIWVTAMYNIKPHQMPYSNDPNWIQLSRLDHNLNVISQHYYGGDGCYVPYDIIESNDSGIVVIGSYFDPNAIPYLHQLDPFLLKTNSEGIVVSSNTHDSPITHEAIVFPNPGAVYLQVILAFQHKSAVIQLFNSIGQIVLEKTISDINDKIDVSFLLTGAYIYRISTDQKIIGTGKWYKSKN